MRNTKINWKQTNKLKHELQSKHVHNKLLYFHTLFQGKKLFCSYHYHHRYVWLCEKRQKFPSDISSVLTGWIKWEQIFSSVVKLQICQICIQLIFNSRTLNVKYPNGTFKMPHISVVNLSVQCLYTSGLQSSTFKTHLSLTPTKIMLKNTNVFKVSAQLHRDKLIQVNINHIYPHWKLLSFALKSCSAPKIFSRITTVRLSKSL